MPFFPNETLEIYEYVETEELNPYYEPKKTYKLVASVSTDFQTLSDSDTDTQAGEFLTDTYRAFVPINTNISEGMKFKLKGKPHTYSLIGHEVVNSRFVPTKHIKLILQIERKPTPLGEDVS